MHAMSSFPSFMIFWLGITDEKLPSKNTELFAGQSFKALISEIGSDGACQNVPAASAVVKMIRGSCWWISEALINKINSQLLQIISPRKMNCYSTYR